MTTNRFVWAVAVALATACGGTEGGGGDAQVQAYAAARDELSGAVATYQAEAGAAQIDEDCRAAEARYGAAAGPALERMRHMSGALSGEGERMRMMSGGDLACGAEAMAAELARHQGVACAGDAVQARAEAEHHVGVMDGWLEQQRQRCEAMQGGAAAPWACQTNADGTFGMHCGEEDWTGCTGGTCPGYTDGACPLAVEPGACEGTCPLGDGSGPHHGMM